MKSGIIGHHRADAAMEIEVRMFNTMTRYAKGRGARCRLSLDAEATVGDVLSQLGIPSGEVYLVMVNGRQITPRVAGSLVWTSRPLQNGDVVALSGPVPFTWK